MLKLRNLNECFFLLLQVKLSLRKIEMHKGISHFDDDNNNHTLNNDDSGRESPSASRPDSAIVRRKRHRSSKTTSAWLTHAQTTHPKTHKSSIEKLMKLILEQGETIQQQLTKLRYVYVLHT